MMAKFHENEMNENCGQTKERNKTKHNKEKAIKE